MIKKSTLVKKLASYSSLASVMLLMDNPATAKEVDLASDSGGVLLTPYQHYYIDLNIDGTTDFVFSVYLGTSDRNSGFNSIQSEYVSPAGNAAFAGSGNTNVHASVFNGSDKIGPDLSWKKGAGILSEK